MVDSSLRGGDLDEDHQSGGPTSPSSSGHKQENPLSLLGQYSDDDEFDEEAVKQEVEVAEGSPKIKLDDQVKQSEVADLDTGSNADLDSGSVETKDQQLDVAKNLDSENVVENNSGAMVSQYGGTDIAIQNDDKTDMQVGGELPGGWRVVIHEQSNQYYYWNTLTGETSWVMPDGLTSNSGMAIGEDIHSTGEVKIECPVLIHAQAHLDPKTYLSVSDTNGHAASAMVIGATEPCATMEHSSGLLIHSLSSIEAKPGENSYSSYGTTDFQFSQLIVYGQSLLERSKSLKGFPNCPEGIELILKEIEIRLSDCQTLLSYGSSLLPFWWHTENQLKQLESVIGVAEVSLVEQETSLIKESSGERSKVVESHSASTVVDNHTSHENTSVVQAEVCMEEHKNEDLSTKEFFSGSVSKDLETNNAVDPVIQLESDISAVNLIFKVETPVEDVDMDVEMEIDDVAIVGDSSTLNNLAAPASLEQLTHPDPLLVECHSIPVEPNIPPPPEEWIPPPPPDSEPVPPPPPPEDPPIPDPPSYADSISIPCQEPYGSVYSLPTYNYYAPTPNEVTNSAYYVQNDASYINGSQQQSYYEPVVASALPEVTACANSAEPVTYYNTSVGAVSNGAVVPSIVPPGFYVASGPLNYTTTAPVVENANSVASSMEPESISVSLPKHSAPLRDSSSGNVLPAHSSEDESGTTQRNGDATAAPIVSSKIQSKVTRKKRVAVAPTLRSNKKVSSLLDKWMAAKEELHGEEDEEPEDAYELLERKRQKEIEEWHASHIASGQALENANFQPLGGDWRERVKRRRAQAAKSEGSKVLVESIEKEKKQPDLVELSKGLPSNWQAYWDESSKEVYYGNNITSETSWTRPTKRGE